MPTKVVRRKAIKEQNKLKPKKLSMAEAMRRVQEGTE